MRYHHALLAALAATLTAAATPDPEAYGTLAPALRNRPIFELLKRQTTYCPLGTYCTIGMTCCGLYCCYTWGTCYGSTELEKYCGLDSGSDNSTDVGETASSSFSSDDFSFTFELPTPSATAPDFTFSFTSASATPTPDSELTPDPSFVTDESDEPSGFSAWPVGRKVGVIVGAVCGGGTVIGVLVWIGLMTCCRKKHKVQTVAQLHAAQGVVPPPPPPPMSPPPMSPPPMSVASPPPGYMSEMEGGHYKPGGYVSSNEVTAPKFDAGRGAYVAGDGAEVYEAPENARQLGEQR